MCVGMHKACDFGNQVMLDELLSVTPDMVNSCLDDGCTLLHRYLFTGLVSELVASEYLL